MAGALPHETCRAPTLPTPNRGNPGRNRDRGAEARHRQQHTAGYDPTLPPFELVVGASRMYLQDDYHLMPLTLKGNGSSGKPFPRNSYANSEKCHGRPVGNGRDWWNYALIDASFRLRFNPRSRNAVQKIPCLTKTDAGPNQATVFPVRRFRFECHRASTTTGRDRISSSARAEP
jgi:hypothetical protein